MLYCGNGYIEKQNIIKVPNTNSLDDVIAILQSNKKDNKEVIVEYKGNYLSTHDLDKDIDLIYGDFYGLSKNDYIKYEIVKRGKKYLYPEKDNDWLMDVYSELNDNDDLLVLLDIFEAIENDPTFKIAKQIFMSHLNIQGLIRKIIRYSNKGPEFIEFIISGHKEDLPEKDKNNIDKLMIIINRQKEKNKEYENNKTIRDIPVINRSDNITIDELYIEIRQAQNRDELLIYKYKGIDIITNSITSIDDLYSIIEQKKH